MDCAGDVTTKPKPTEVPTPAPPKEKGSLLHVHFLLCVGNQLPQIGGGSKLLKGVIQKVRNGRGWVRVCYFCDKLL